MPTLIVHRIRGHLVEQPSEDILGVVPHRVGADTLFRPGRSLTDHFLEAEIAVDRHHQVIDLQALRLELLLGAEHMRIVLGEGADPHQPVQRAGRLIPVHIAEFGQPDRQITVGFQPVLEDLHMAGAVHRLEREDRLSASSSSGSSVTANMFSWYQPQWPEVSHRLLSRICGALTSS
jgi:hypothetical protein